MTVRRGDPLAPPEVEVLEMLLDGKNGDQIGAALRVHPSTVWRRCERACVKLGASTYYQVTVKFDRIRRKA